MATTLHWCVFPDFGATPSAAQVVAGQIASGAPAPASGSEPYTAAGTYDEATAITSLASGTAYRVAWVAFDGSTYSAVEVSAAITTGVPSPAITLVGAENITANSVGYRVTLNYA